MKFEVFASFQKMWPQLKINFSHASRFSIQCQENTRHMSSNVFFKIKASFLNAYVHLPHNNTVAKRRIQHLLDVQILIVESSLHLFGLKL